jgi:HlyD family type I secretion membrane fusion protein
VKLEIHDFETSLPPQLTIGRDSMVMTKSNKGHTIVANLHPAANVNTIIRNGIIAILLVFGGLGTWAAVAPLAGAVIGHGVVKVDSNRKTVQHLEGGIVSEIRVRDGDHVVAGQVLLVLVDERVNASVEILRGQLNEDRAKAARLEAERNLLEEIEFPESLTSQTNDTKIIDLLERERRFFKIRLDNLNDSISLHKEMKREIAQEIVALREQMQNINDAMKLLQEELSSNEALEKNQYIQKSVILTMKRNMEDYRTRNNVIKSEIHRAEQKITDMDIRIVQLQNEYQQRAAQELTGANSTGVYAEISSLEERLRPSLDAKRRQEIIAPISGTVVDLKVFTVGGVVAPRQPLMDIVPDNNPLVVEAKINVDDIDNVSMGQEADVRLTAYRTRNTPLVLGKVIYVSADRLVDENSANGFYITRIELDKKSLADAGDISLYPGMSAEVFIRTGERTALQYMLAPVTATLRRSFREP